MRISSQRDWPSSKSYCPSCHRIAVVACATSPATAQYVKEAELAAQTLGVRLQVVPVNDPGDLAGALSAIQGASVLVVADGASLVLLACCRNGRKVCASDPG